MCNYPLDTWPCHRDILDAKKRETTAEGIRTITDHYGLFGKLAGPTMNMTWVQNLAKSPDKELRE